MSAEGIADRTQRSQELLASALWILETTAGPGSFTAAYVREAAELRRETAGAERRPARLPPKRADRAGATVADVLKACISCSRE